MASGRRVPVEERVDVLCEYYAGEHTVEQIARAHGIKPRTIYAWAAINGHNRRTINRAEPRKKIAMTSDEIELVLLMILECDGIMPQNKRPTMLGLEARLLDAADELAEIRRTACNEPCPQ